MVELTLCLPLEAAADLPKDPGEEGAPGGLGGQGGGGGEQGRQAGEGGHGSLTGHQWPGGQCSGKQTDQVHGQCRTYIL